MKPEAIIIKKYFTKLLPYLRSDKTIASKRKIEKKVEPLNEIAVYA
jgi:hypothetical protein